jgi:hypothetical protein
MSIIQILIVLFVIFAISRTIRQFRSGALTLLWLMVWALLWVAVGAITLTPQTTDVIASKLGVGRGVDVVIYLSLIALFYLVFRLFTKIEDVEREITRLVRKLALEDEEEKKKL